MNLLRTCKNTIKNVFLPTKRSLHRMTMYEPMAIRPGREPIWCSQEDAFFCLKSGMNVFLGGAAGTPKSLINAMACHAKENCLTDIGLTHIHMEGDLLFLEPEFEKEFFSNSMFMGANARKPVAEGRADMIPIFLHEIPYVFYRKIIELDMAVFMVSPPDKHGYCSTGTSVDCLRSALRCSPYKIAQVNDCMPRTFGDSSIHISQIDVAVRLDEPIAELATSKMSKEEKIIGKLIADELVEDGATLQFGIGAIPGSVLESLKCHQDLGIHTEMLTSQIVDLWCSGAVTNAKKQFNKGRTVASFMLGDRRLYDFVDDNPIIEMLRIEWVNDHSTVIKMPKMTAINAAIEIDLTGQVVADSIGTRMYSGFGGQVDFIRGAGNALDGKGKPIIAILSTTKKGDSKIVPYLRKGAGVVTSRAHVQYVVTEYGIAHLFGRNLRQRAHALIQIAHPDCRECLEKAAYERLKTMPCPY